MILEVCVDSAESAVAAEQGGAGRVELCADLEHGGTTPSVGMIRSVREKVSLKIHVMIRPRAGGFCYSESEFELMKRVVREVKDIGIDGLVLGILTSKGAIDTARTGILIQIARPLSVTFHRAFDESVDLFAAFSDLIQLGVDRVLTSGGEASVDAGMKTLADLVRRSGPTTKVIAGGGITLENVADVIEKTGVKEIHTLRSVSSTVIGGSSDSIQFPSCRMVVDPHKVRRMVDIIHGLSPRK